MTVSLAPSTYTYIVIMRAKSSGMERELCQLLLLLHVCSHQTSDHLTMTMKRFSMIITEKEVIMLPYTYYNSTVKNNKDKGFHKDMFLPPPGQQGMRVQGLGKVLHNSEALLLLS